MANNDFLVFATANGADVMDQADWVALAARLSGFQVGIADPLAVNKAWRQALFVTAAVAQLIPDALNVNAADDGDFNTFVANLKAAISASNALVRVITAAGPQAVNLTDRNVVVNQAVAAAIQLNLPAVPTQNYGVSITDGKGDAGANPITISGNGNTINGQATAIINNPYGSISLIWNGTEFNINAAV